MLNRNAKIEVVELVLIQSPRMKHFNISQMVLFLNSLPFSLESLPQGIPLEMKFGMILATAIALVISSYINSRSHLHKKIILLQANVSELEKIVASLNTNLTYMQSLSTDTEAKLVVVEQCVDFMFTNNSHVQKALHKKIELEEKYRSGKKEAYLTKNRQEAIQEYQNAKKTVARRFNEV